MHSVVSVKKPTACPRWKVTGADGIPVPVAGTGWPGAGALPTCGCGGIWGAAGCCCARLSRPKRFFIYLRLLHVAHECLALMHRDVGIHHQRRQRVDDVAGRVALVAPVPWHANLMHQLAVDREWAQSPGYQCTSIDR